MKGRGKQLYSEEVRSQPYPEGGLSMFNVRQLVNFDFSARDIVDIFLSVIMFLISIPSQL